MLSIYLGDKLSLSLSWVYAMFTFENTAPGVTVAMMPIPWNVFFPPKSNIVIHIVNHELHLWIEPWTIAADLLYILISDLEYEEQNNFVDKLILRF